MAINKALMQAAQCYAPKWGIAAEEQENKPLLGSRRLSQTGSLPATRKGFNHA